MNTKGREGGRGYVTCLRALSSRFFVSMGISRPSACYSAWKLKISPCVGCSMPLFCYVLFLLNLSHWLSSLRRWHSFI